VGAASLVLLIGALLIGCASASRRELGADGDAAGADAPLAGDRWLVGYYTGYDNWELPVAAIDWASLTHLAVAFYPPDGSDGLDESLALPPGDGPALAHELVAAAHARGVKVIASIGGAARRSSLAVAASSAHRAAFVASVAAFVASYGYDGIDIDWEPIESGDAATLVALVGDLRTALPGASISVPLLPFNMNDTPDTASVAMLVPVVDRLAVMSYGMSGTDTGWDSWHSSPLHWNQNDDTPVGIDATVDALLAAGIPAAKLGIGAGFFGQCYTKPVDKPLQSLSGSTISIVDYSVISASYLPATTRQWDSDALVPYLAFSSPHAPDDCTYITYEDDQSLTAKASYARAKGLGGMIVWTLNQGYVASAPAGQANHLQDVLWTSFVP
jgi:chitinase